MQETIFNRCKENRIKILGTFVRAVGQRIGGGVVQFEGETSVEIVKTKSNFTKHCLRAINTHTHTDKHTHTHGHSLGPHDSVVWVALCWVSELSGYDHLSNTALRREGELRCVTKVR